MKVIRVLLIVISLLAGATAQEIQTKFVLMPRSDEGLSLRPVPSEPAAPQHKFFDRKNLALFAGVSTVRALDLHSTWHFRNQGYSEMFLSNKIVDNKAAFAGMTAGIVAGHVAICYALHRSGHHELERAFSYVHIGVVGANVVNNYSMYR